MRLRFIIWCALWRRKYGPCNLFFKKIQAPSCHCSSVISFVKVMTLKTWLSHFRCHLEGLISQWECWPQDTGQHSQQHPSVISHLHHDMHLKSLEGLSLVPFKVLCRENELWWHCMLLFFSFEVKTQFVKIRSAISSAFFNLTLGPVPDFDKEYFQSCVYCLVAITTERLMHYYHQTPSMKMHFSSLNMITWGLPLPRSFVCVMVHFFHMFLTGPWT